MLDEDAIALLKSALNVPISKVTVSHGRAAHIQSSPSLDLLISTQTSRELEVIRRQRQQHGHLAYPVGWPAEIRFGNTLRWQHSHRCRYVASLFDQATDKIRREASLGIPLFYIAPSTVPDSGLGLFANVTIHANTKDLISYVGNAYVVNSKTRKVSESDYIATLVHRLVVDESGKRVSDCSDSDIVVRQISGSVEIDAQMYGNESRFINCCHNTGRSANVVFQHYQDSNTGEPRLAVDILNRDILPHEELLLEYGDKYWTARQQRLQINAEESSNTRAANNNKRLHRHKTGKRRQTAIKSVPLMQHGDAPLSA